METNDIIPAVGSDKNLPEPKRNEETVFSLVQAVLLAVTCTVIGLVAGEVFDRYQEQQRVIEDSMIPPQSDNSFDAYDEYYGNYESETSVSTTSGKVPLESAYKILYESVYYTREDGYDTYVAAYSDAFEYLNEDFVKDDKHVYYRGEAQQGVDPKECTLQNLAGCSEDRSWEETVEPYSLEVSWFNEATKAADLIPEFGAQCRSAGYTVGEITNGLLAGSPLLVQMDEICGMWCGGLALLEAHHFVKYGDYTIPVAGNTGFAIKDIATSTRTERIPIPNSSLALVSEGSFGLHGVGSESDRVSYLFTDPVVGDIYRDEYACFVSTRPDQVEIAYSLELPFTYRQDNGELPYNKLDGTSNEEVYKAYRDYNSCLSRVDGASMDESTLIKAGEFPGGIEIYELADKESPELIELYNNPNTLASYQEGKNIYTYEEFISYKPYLYWQDPFGDWVELLNKRFDVAAEKCKPVIYLYPEAKGNFEVTVAPNGGFTETIPEYRDGWKVMATPESLITDTRTGEQYPYLYWEGVNTGIPEMTEGWVVAVDGMEPFLKEKLAILGLNEREIADFNEYWLDRFVREGAASYKIMFVPKVVFDELAPLTVTGDETPQTVIRVMMYAQPAQSGDTLPPQLLPPTPVRHGFSVVEWGGALLH